MFRTLALAGALAALAIPAFADTAVAVNVNGLDPKAVHEAIIHAAQKACREEIAGDSDLVRFYTRPLCLDDTVARAEAKYQEMRGLASR